MQRKLLGMFTAVTAALLLVGVAWASGDRARDDSSSSSVAGTPRSVDMTSVTVADTVTSVTAEDNGGTTNSIDDNGGTTNTSIDDNGGTTNTSIDDNGGDRDGGSDDGSGHDDGDRDGGSDDGSGHDDDDDHGGEDDDS